MCSRRRVPLAYRHALQFRDRIHVHFVAHRPLAFKLLHVANACVAGGHTLQPNVLLHLLSPRGLLSRRHPWYVDHRGGPRNHATDQKLPGARISTQHESMPGSPRITRHESRAGPKQRGAEDFLRVPHRIHPSACFRPNVFFCVEGRVRIEVHFEDVGLQLNSHARQAAVIRMALPATKRPA